MQSWVSLDEKKKVTQIFKSQQGRDQTGDPVVGKQGRSLYAYRKYILD